MTAPATQAALQRLAHPLRSRSQAGWVAFALGSVALLLGAVAWTVRLGWLRAPYWVLLAWGLALLALAGVAYLGWASRTRLSTPRLARSLEDLGEWRRGTLTALLDGAAGGTSSALLDLADQAHAREVEQRGSGRGRADRPAGPGTGPGRRGVPPDRSRGLCLGRAGAGCGRGAVASATLLGGDRRTGATSRRLGPGRPGPGRLSSISRRWAAEWRPSGSARRVKRGSRAVFASTPPVKLRSRLHHWRVISSPGSPAGAVPQIP